MNDNDIIFNNFVDSAQQLTTLVMNELLKEEYPGIIKVGALLQAGLGTLEVFVDVATFKTKIDFVNFETQERLNLIVTGGCKSH